MPGKLIVCATPIGNLDDLTFRALKALQEADLIAAEDTRHTLGLLNHFDIHKPLISCHQHNENERSGPILDALREGKNVVLVSDAGTPAISDPGEVLVRNCIAEGIEVTALPGACAFVTALSASGMPSRAFIFEGFLPPAAKDRRKVAESLKNEERTVIFYEAPHHLKETLRFLYQELGERPIVLGRELTKIHEEYRHLLLSEAVLDAEQNVPRGEYVLIIGGRSAKELEEEKKQNFLELSLTDHMALHADLPRKEAMKLVAAERGLSKREVYAQLLKEEEENG